MKPVTARRMSRSGGEPTQAKQRRSIHVLYVVCVGLIGCGYRLNSTVNNLPPTLHVLAVTPFENRTPAPRLSQAVTSSVIHAFISRTRYRVQPTISGSDAVLSGSVFNLTATPVTYDPTSGRATTVEVTMHIKAWLTDRHTGKELFRNDDMVFHDQYEVSAPSRNFFEQDQLAFQRMTQTVARTLTSAILEAF